MNINFFECFVCLNSFLDINPLIVFRWIFFRWIDIIDDHKVNHIRLEVWINFKYTNHYSSVDHVHIHDLDIDHSNINLVVSFLNFHLNFFRCSIIGLNDWVYNVLNIFFVVDISVFGHLIVRYVVIVDKWSRKDVINHVIREFRNIFYQFSNVIWVIRLIRCCLFVFIRLLYVTIDIFSIGLSTLSSTALRTVPTKIASASDTTSDALSLLSSFLFKDVTFFLFLLVSFGSCLCSRYRYKNTYTSNMIIPIFYTFSLCLFFLRLR